MAGNVVFITQARSGSTRLPGKVLKKVQGRSLLEWFLARARRTVCTSLCVATTTNEADDDLAALVREEGDVHLTRGSEADVLGRYVQAASETEADVIVRVTSDCPVFDWHLIDRAVEILARTGADAVRTGYRAYPLGLDVEVYSRQILERMEREAKEQAEREHVGPYLFQNHPDLFGIRWLVPDVGELPWPDCRLTLDYPEDLAFVEALFAALGPLAEAEDYRRYLLVHPEVAAINGHLLR